MTTRKEFAELRRIAEAAGWTVTMTSGGHLRWAAPSGAIVFSSSSPSDWRAVHKHRSELRKKGLDC